MLNFKTNEAHIKFSFLEILIKDIESVIFIKRIYLLKKFIKK